MANAYSEVDNMVADRKLGRDCGSTACTALLRLESLPKFSLNTNTNSNSTAATNVDSVEIDMNFDIDVDVDVDTDIPTSRSAPPKKYQRVLYCANVGDSRIVLCRNSSPVRLTLDHRCADPSEVKRIKDSGGFVFNRRVGGVLAVTRAIGHINDKVIESEAKRSEAK